MERYKHLLDNILALHNIPDWPKDLSRFLQSLFKQCFDKYAASQKGNPIDHHICVLQNAIDIAAGEKFEGSEIKRITCAALVHDIFTPEKIRKGDKTSSDAETTRKYSRAVHMFFSSTHAAEVLAEINHDNFLTIQELAWIQAMTATHDNPSAGLPLPFEKEILAFREADRLWMISPPGFTFDLLKDIRKELTRTNQEHNTDLPIPDSETWNDFEKRQLYIEKAKKDRNKWSVIQQLAQARVHHIAERYQDDANLYPASKREKLHNGTLFFTDTGYKLYLRKRQQVESLFEIKSTADTPGM